MKKILTMGMLALLLTGCANAADSDSNNKGYITVNTEATEELSPTSVKISFAISTHSKDAQTAADLNRQTSERALNAVKSLVDTKNGETIKTTSYYLNPEYSYKDGTSKLTGYKASNTLQVKLKDVEKAGKIISLALANGANSVNNLEFGLDDTDTNCDTLLQKAAANARKRADKVASSLGTSVQGIKRINMGCSANQTNFRGYRMLTNAKALGSSDAAEVESAPIEAGKTMLRAYTDIDFYVK